MKRVAFYTLGCKLNFAETSSISRSFEALGYQKVAFGDPTDVYVINTCSVTEQADKKCRKVVNEGLKISPSARVVIIGCYAQLKPEEIASIPGVDLVLGANAKFDAAAQVEKLGPGKASRIVAGPISEIQDFKSSWSVSDRTRTFLKVQDGCDYPCTYCTIPLARGKSRSDSVERVVEEARNIGNSGVREIVLTGVNIGDFGIRNGKREETFFDLVQALDKIESVPRFRISSIEPNLLSNDIIDFVAQSERFMPHFHIPLQSGSNEILGKMKRRYRRELYADRVKQIRSQMPDACIGVDVIVGFPGETEAIFLDTYQFLNELDISYLHVFPYSERPNTEAIQLAGKVSQQEKNRRSQMLHILSDKKRRAFYETHLGKMETVLFEAARKGGMMEGFTRNYIKVTAPYDPMWVNEEIRGFLNAIGPEGHVDFGEFPIPSSERKITVSSAQPKEAFSVA
jgi:threonylcarbamoyladenosine tRNA methylthiotransferase MtaB